VAKESPEWSSGHRETIKEIEKELGREICGLPVGLGLPCKKWPVDKSHGRCSEHAPDFADSTSTVEVASTGEDSRPQTSPTMFNRLFNLPVIIVLVATGLLLGLILSAGIIYSLERNGFISSAGDYYSQPGDQASAEDLDFQEISRLFERSEYNRLEEKLRHQLAEGRTAAREDALYYLFVLYQRTGRPGEAIRAGREFVEEYSEHARAPEVLYSLTRIAADIMGDSELAEKFYNKLQEEYPETRWTEKATTFF